MNLRPLSGKDIPGILEWMQDPELNCYFRFNPDEVSVDSVADFVASSYSKENKHYAVVDDQDVYLGTISLKNISPGDRNAEYAVSLRKKAIGTGAAEFATRELLRIAFMELGLNKVYLNVLAENVRAIRFYQKMGFEFEGEFAEHIQVQGQFRNIRWYGIRRKQYDRIKR